MCCLSRSIIGTVAVHRSAWEYCVQEMLDYNLVLFSPYRDLVIYLEDSRLKPLADFAW